MQEQHGWRAYTQNALWLQLAYCRRLASFQTAVPLYVHPSWGSPHAGLLFPWQSPIVSDDWDAANKQSFFFGRGVPALFFATLEPKYFQVICEQVFLWLCRCDTNLLISGKRLRILGHYFSQEVIEAFLALPPFSTQSFLDGKNFSLPFPAILKENNVSAFVFGVLYSWLYESLPPSLLHRVSLRFDKEGVQNTFYKNLFSSWPLDIIDENLDNILLHVCPDYSVVRGS